jgi:hypothetical protein
MTLHAGKTAAGTNTTKSIAIITLGAGTAGRARSTSGDWARGAGRVNGRSAAGRGRCQAKGTRRRRSEAERRGLGQDLQARLEAAELFQISRARLLPDDAGAELREPRCVAVVRGSNEGTQQQHPRGGASRGRGSRKRAGRSAGRWKDRCPNSAIECSGTTGSPEEPAPFRFNPVGSLCARRSGH